MSHISGSPPAMEVKPVAAALEAHEVRKMDKEVPQTVRRWPGGGFFWPSFLGFGGEMMLKYLR